MFLMLVKRMGLVFHLRTLDGSGKGCVAVRFFQDCEMNGQEYFIPLFEWFKIFVETVTYISIYS